MGRRKHQFYQKELKFGRKQTRQTQEFSPQRIPAHPSATATRLPEKLGPNTSHSTFPAQQSQTFFGKPKRSRNPRKLKRILINLSAASAGLNWLATVVGYLVIQHNHQSLSDDNRVSAALKTAVCSIALVQVVLVGLYWKVSIEHREAMRRALRSGSIPVKKLRQSLGAMTACALECGFQVIVFYPGAQASFSVMIFGGKWEMTYDDFMYLLVLIRNYHSLRLLYWLSDLSDLRTQLFTQIADVNFGLGFVARWHFAVYNLKCMIVLYGVMVIIPGIVEYLFEYESGQLSNQWNDFWIVAYTQSTIGYGETPPATFCGQVMILISCFFGVFTLGLLNTVSSRTLVLTLTECTVYSELLYSRQKQKHKRQAVLMIQRWWRLMLMRTSHTISGHTILSFYSQLRVFRSALVDCQHVKDTRFERQIQAFDRSVRSRIRPLNEYLKPVQDAYATVRVRQLQDMLRSAYHMKTICRNVCKFAHRHKVRDDVRRLRSSVCDDTSDDASHGGTTSRSHHRTPRLQSEQSSQGLAKAKFLAFHNVRGRLVRDELTPSPVLSGERTV